MTKWILAFFAIAAFAASAQAASAKIPLGCDSTSQQLSSTGEQALVRCQDNSVRLISLPSGKEERTISAGKAISTYQFSSDGKDFAISRDDGSIQVFSSTPQASPIAWQLGLPADDIQFLPGNKVVVVSPHARPGEVWDIAATPTKIATLATDFDGLTSVGISSDGKLVATCGADTVVRIWDTSTWKLKSEYRQLLLEPFAAAFTLDGKWLLMGGADQQVTILDANTAAEIRKLPRQPDPFDNIAVLDANHIAVRYFDEDGVKPPHVLRWNLQSGTSQPIALDRPVSGGGVVKGKLWLANATGRELEIWSAE